MKRIVLCADDYGQAPTISHAIIDLLKNNRLSATSCLVNSKRWQEEAAWLQPFKAKADIGLHFNLTEGRALSFSYRRHYGNSFSSLPNLLSASCLHRLKEPIIEAECEAQLDHFTSAMGCLPDFIDGHHHIHQFPLIRQAVIRVFLKHLLPAQSYIRFVQPTFTHYDFSANLKKLFIYLLSTRSFKKQLMTHGIPYNMHFAGMYAFKHAAFYGQLFPRFIKEIHSDGLIMCHPGQQVSNNPTKMDQARFAEYCYLSSDQFVQDCHAEGAILGRFFNKASAC